MGTLQAADHMVLMVLGTGKWCYLAIKGGREGEGGIRSCSLVNEKKKKKRYWSEFSLLLWVYTAPHSLSQTAKRKANTEGKNIQGELADASLRQHPFHGDYSSERRRRCAFLWETRCFSLLRSQFPRATGGRKATFFCVYRHGQYFITSLFTWSKNQVVRSSSRRYCILFVEWNLRSAAQDAKGIPDRSSFPGSCAVTEKHGNLWLFGGAWKMPGRPRT